MKEDFNQKNENEFNLEFFLKKATTSITKCLAMIEKCGMEDSEMAKYVNEMQS